MKKWFVAIIVTQLRTSAYANFFSDWVTGKIVGGRTDSGRCLCMECHIQSPGDPVSNQETPEIDEFNNEIHASQH